MYNRRLENIDMKTHSLFRISQTFLLNFAFFVKMNFKKGSEIFVFFPRFFSRNRLVRNFTKKAKCSHF